MGLELLEQLVALENNISEFAKRGDRAGIESMLDPAFTLVDHGRLFSRSAYLSTIKPRPDIISCAVESPEVRHENDRAVLTGYMNLQVRRQHQPKIFRIKFRDVFIQDERDGRWLFRVRSYESGFPSGASADGMSLRSVQAVVLHRDQIPAELPGGSRRATIR